MPWRKGVITRYKEQVQKTLSGSPRQISLLEATKENYLAPDEGLQKAKKNPEILS